MKKIFINIFILSILCLNSAFSESIYGLGVKFIKDPYNNKLFVYKVIENSNAQKYGLIEGSEIITINNTDITELSLIKITDLIKDKTQTKIKFKIKYSKEQLNIEIPKTIYTIPSKSQDKFETYWEKIAPSEIVTETISTNILNNISKGFTSEIVPVINYWISRKEEFRNSYYSCLLYDLKNQNTCIDNVVKMSIDRTSQHYEAGFKSDLVNAKKIEKNISDYN